MAEVEKLTKNELRDIMTSVITQVTNRFYLAVAILGILIIIGIIAYITQISYGLGVTGLNSTFIWGIYIASFIYFVAISMSGTLVSAILRVTKAKWGIPIARLAEMITISAFMFAVLQIMFDLGRPDRILHTIFWGRLQSPSTWDLYVILTYAFGSCIYFYITLIPDLSFLYNEGKVKGFIATFYNILSVNWRGTKEQVDRLNKAIKILAVTLIPTAVSFHSVASWTLAMNVRPGWHTTILGPDFVTAAIYSAMAILITIMWIYVRMISGADKYIKEVHFRYMGYLLFVSCLALIYMKTCHMLTEYYGGVKMSLNVLNSLLFGEWAFIFWGFVSTSLIIPVITLPIILFYKRKLMVNGLFIISILVNLGLYFDRLYIVISPLSRPYLPYPHVTYIPSWVEYSLIVASFAGFSLIYLMLLKIFPPICIWETKSVYKINDKANTIHSSKPTSVNPLPRVILVISIACYIVLMYIIARFLIIPIYAPEGYVAVSESYKILAIPVTIAVTAAWLSIVYAIYQICKIAELDLEKVNT